METLPQPKPPSPPQTLLKPRRRVLVESPYRAETEQGLRINLRYARAAVRDAVLRGEAPIASHLLLTQPGILKDDVPEERELGIDAGHQWMAAADAVVVYTDYGISPGMKRAIDLAGWLGVPVERRSIPVPFPDSALPDLPGPASA